MISRIKTFLAEHSAEEAFFTLIKTLFGRYGKKYKLIHSVYRLSENAFEGKFRDSGEPFFEHQKRVALIYIFVGGRNATIIAALLVHDLIEDVDGWTEERVAEEVNEKIAVLVFGVTKPKVSMFDGDRNLRNANYFVKLMFGSFKRRMMKLCDHLDNLIHIDGLSKSKLDKLISQCKNLYLPIAIHSQFLLREIREALTIAEHHHKNLQ